MQTDPVASPRRSPSWSLTIKIVIGVMIIVLLGLAAYAFRVVFIPLIVGAIVAYILTPLVRLVSRVTRLSHGLATTLVYVALLAIVIPLGVFGVQALIVQGDLLRIQLIKYVQHLSSMGANTFQFMGFELQVEQVINQVSTSLLEVMRSAAPNTLLLVLRSARTVVMGVFTFVIAFYFTRDSDKVAASIMGLTPPDYREDVMQLLSEINGVWSAFLRGQMILSLTVMVILTIVSAILGLPQPLILGVWGGLLEFLPSIGNMIWGATALILAAVGGSTTLHLPPTVFILLVLGVYVAFAQLDINILIPNIIGGQVRLHPMIVLVGVILGLTVGGVLGVAVAAPTIASLRVIGRYVYAKLFDMDPFPMVGPPAAPRTVREEEARRLAEENRRASKPRTGRLRRLTRPAADEEEKKETTFE